jgi:hypothetical protein
MTRAVAPGAFAGALLAFAGVAHGDDGRSMETVSITFSPVHLVLPVFEVTGEVRAADRIGVAGILGGGSVDVEGLADRVSMFEVGAQGRFYALGSFRHGLQVGGEAMYVHASAASGGVTATAAGVSLGGFVGYKWIAGIGFTFDGQLGYQVYGLGASSSEGETSEQSGHGVLLNLNVGWSF